MSETDIRSMRQSPDIATQALANALSSRCINPGELRVVENQRDSAVAELEFPAEVDDLGGSAAIAAGPHHQPTDPGTEFSFGIDVEELLCLRLAADHPLGDVFYRRLHGRMFGCWTMPESGDAVKLLACAPESSAVELSAMDVRDLLSIARESMIISLQVLVSHFPGFVEPRGFSE